MTTQEWLEEATKQAGLSADEQAALSNVFTKNTKLAKYVEESGLRQSDYSRNMARLKDEHESRMAEIAEKERAADQFAAQNGQWYAENNTKYQKTLKEIEDLRVQQAQLQERMKGVASRYGVPDEELHLPVVNSPVNAPVVNTPTFDESKFVSRDAAERELRGSLFFQTELADLIDEHKELFGGRGFNKTEFTKKALDISAKSGGAKKLRQIWEEEFKVADKRKELDEQQIQARINAAVAERENKIRSEVHLPAPRPAEQRSAVVDRFAKSAQPEKGDPGRGVRAAIASYYEGKDRIGGPGKAA